MYDMRIMVPRSVKVMQGLLAADESGRGATSSIVPLLSGPVRSEDRVRQGHLCSSVLS